MFEFKGVKKDGHFYIHKFTEDDAGTWYSADRGVYIVPDIIIDLIHSGSYTNSYYDYLVYLYDNHRDIFKPDINIKEIILLDEYVYEEMNKIENWFNDPNKFIIPDGYFIGVNEEWGDFGLWPVHNEDQE